MQRRAITLIEIMVVAALASVVMGVVISLFVALKQKDRELRLFAVQSGRQNELAETLRTDIRRATRVALAAQTALLVTSSDERQTRYELTAGGCRRIVAEVGEAKPRVDFFAIGPAAAWSLEQGPAGRRPLYIAALQRTASTADEPPRGMPLLIYAALGADLPISN